MSNRNYIRSKVIELLLRRGHMTRPEGVRLFGVRAASLFEAIDSLKAEGVIREPERQGRRTGRRAPLLEFAPDHLWCVGLDFQEECTIGVVVNMAGEVQCTVERPSGGRETAEACWADIHRVIDELRECCGAAWSRVRGIGLADPGLVDRTQGVSLRAVNLPGWRDIPSRQTLEERYGLQASIWPDCAVHTYMEYVQRQEAIGGGSLFYMGLGTGVGGGFVRDGKCFYGDSNLAMEIGHVVVNPDGPLCQCGNRGCLEAYAGKNGIRRRVEETLSSGVNTLLALEDFSLARFAEAVRQDKAALLIATEAAEYVGRALSTLVTLLNPTWVVLGNELTAWGDLLLDAVRRNLASNCFPRALEGLHLEISTLPRTAAARGAALMLRNDLLCKEFSILSE